MTLRRTLAAVLAVALPTLLSAPAAEALTARQYQSQGHGRYIHSTGSRVSVPGHRYGRYHATPRHHRRHHR